MRVLRLQHRLVIPFVLVALIGTSAASLVALSVFSRALQARLETQLAGAAVVVSRADFALNPAILERVRDVVGADVITVDGSGQVVQSTLPDGRRDLEAAVAGAARSTGGDGGTVAAWMDCGVPCLVVSRGVEGRPGHVVALVADTSDLTATSRAVSRTILLAAAASVVVMILVSQAVVRRVTQPLRQLVRFARDLSPNDSRRLPALGDDEINAVADALNGMLDRLGHAQAALVRSEKLGLAGLMAARVAHDIRNPLSSIKMQTQLLRSRLRGDADDEATLTSVLHDIELVESVIRDLLELARPGELRLEPVSVNLVVRDALQQLAAQFTHRRIVVAERLDERLPVVRLDAARFKQALLNVLANASEAMPTGGTVTVASRPSGGAGVTIEICDDGVGVDPAMLDKVFDPFVSTKRDGMGLGLVNVKAVVESHGGRIELAARRPKGTCVAITLPAAAGTRDNAPGEAANPQRT